MYIAKFNNHNKFKTNFGKHLTDIEKTANPHAAKLLTSDHTHDNVDQTPKGSHGTTSKIDDITRSKYLASHKFRQTQKVKQNEKNEAKNEGGLCNLTIFYADLETRTNTWQQVDMEKTMYVFSAYYTQTKVYIIGVKPRKSVEVICQLWSWDAYGDLTVTQETMATVTSMEGGYSQKFVSKRLLTFIFGSVNGALFISLSIRLNTKVLICITFYTEVLLLYLTINLY
jgi:hypothetical protein